MNNADVLSLGSDDEIAALHTAPRQEKRVRTVSPSLHESDSPVVDDGAVCDDDEDDLGVMDAMWLPPSELVDSPPPPSAIGAPAAASSRASGTPVRQQGSIPPAAPPVELAPAVAPAAAPSILPFSTPLLTPTSALRGAAAGNDDDDGDDELGVMDAMFFPGGMSQYPSDEPAVPASPPPPMEDTQPTVVLPLAQAVVAAPPTAVRQVPVPPPRLVLKHTPPPYEPPPEAEDVDTQLVESPGAQPAEEATEEAVVEVHDTPEVVEAVGVDVDEDEPDEEAVLVMGTQGMGDTEPYSAPILEPTVVPSSLQEASPPPSPVPVPATAAETPPVPNASAARDTQLNTAPNTSMFSLDDAGIADTMVPFYGKLAGASDSPPAAVKTRSLTMSPYRDLTEAMEKPADTPASAAVQPQTRTPPRAPSHVLSPARGTPSTVPNTPQPRGTPATLPAASPRASAGPTRPSPGSFAARAVAAATKRHVPTPAMHVAAPPAPQPPSRTPSPQLDIESGDNDGALPVPPPPAVRRTTGIASLSGPRRRVVPPRRSGTPVVVPPTDPATDDFALSLDEERPVLPKQPWLSKRSKPSGGGAKPVPKLRRRSAPAPPPPPPTPPPTPPTAARDPPSPSPSAPSDAPTPIPIEVYWRLQYEWYKATLLREVSHSGVTMYHLKYCDGEETTAALPRDAFSVDTGVLVDGRGVSRKFRWPAKQPTQAEPTKRPSRLRRASSRHVTFDLGSSTPGSASGGTRRRERSPAAPEAAPSRRPRRVLPADAQEEPPPRPRRQAAPAFVRPTHARRVTESTVAESQARHVKLKVPVSPLRSPGARKTAAAGVTPSRPAPVDDEFVAAGAGAGARVSALAKQLKDHNPPGQAAKHQYGVLPEPRRRRTKLQRLFTGYRFLITGFSGSSAPSADTADMSSDAVSNLITAHGGYVVRKLTDVAPREDDDSDSSDGNTQAQAGRLPVFVIARPTAYRTCKYLFSVARGLPPLHVAWVQACVAAGAVVDATPFALPAGLLHGQHLLFLPPVPHTSFHALSRERRPLAGTRVVVSGEYGLREWRLLAHAAGAALVDSDEFARRRAKADVVVCTGGRGGKVARAAHAQGVPVVTTDWAIQSLVQQTSLPAGGDDFAHTDVGEGNFAWVGTGQEGASQGTTSYSVFRLGSKVYTVGETVYVKGDLARVEAVWEDAAGGRRLRVQRLRTGRKGAHPCGGSEAGESCPCRGGVALSSFVGVECDMDDVGDKFLLLATHRLDVSKFGCTRDVWFCDAVPAADEVVREE